MRVSFILSSLRLSGGVRVVIQYANQLSKRGHQINLIIPKGEIGPGIAAEIGSNIEIIQAKRSLEGKTNPYKLLCLTWKMAKAVPRSDVIIATHTPTTAVSLLAGKVFRKGKIIWFYQDYVEMFEGRPMERWLLRNALRWHDLALTVSEAGTQELHSFSPRQVIKIGEGLDKANVYHPVPDAKRLYHGPLDKRVIFFLGDSRPRKGMADFIHAAEKVYTTEPNLELWIASKENLEIQTGVPFKLILQPNDSDLVKLYSSCDVFVSASWYEGFGLPPLEAMACGAAVVTTDSRGIREFAIDGENCLIVPPKNPDKLAEAIQLLISNPDQAERLRNNGPSTAARFNWSDATDRFESVLLEMGDHLSAN